MIVPTYNCGHFVVEAIASILAQTRPVDEIIVVDDGSVDDTPKRMAQFGALVRYIQKDNGGVSSARNRGIDEAKGDVISFLDADDVWHPRKMEIQLTAMARHPEIGLLGTDLYDWPGEHPVYDLLETGRVDEVLLEDLVVRNTLATSAIIARADVIRAAGPFDTNLQGPEDYDLWIRVAQQSRVANLHIALTGYRRITPGSLSKNVVRMETGMRTILEKVEASGVFQGRPLLRRKAWSYYWYSSGISRRLAGDQARAMSHCLRSLLCYPLYDRKNFQRPFGRIRMLAVIALARIRTFRK